MEKDFYIHIDQFGEEVSDELSIVPRTLGFMR